MGPPFRLAECGAETKQSMPALPARYSGLLEVLRITRKDSDCRRPVNTFAPQTPGAFGLGEGAAAAVGLLAGGIVWLMDRAKKV